MAAESRTALIAETDSGIRDVLDVILTRLGYAVTAVGDGAAAYMVIGAGPPEVAVLDVVLPAVGGLSLGRLLKTLQPAAKVIVLSTPGTDPADAALEAGMDAVLPGALSATEMEREVARHLGGS